MPVQPALRAAHVARHPPRTALACSGWLAAYVPAGNPEICPHCWFREGLASALVIVAVHGKVDFVGCPRRELDEFLPKAPGAPEFVIPDAKQAQTATAHSQDVRQDSARARHLDSYKRRAPITNRVRPPRLLAEAHRAKRPQTQIPGNSMVNCQATNIRIPLQYFCHRPSYGCILSTN